MIRKFLILTAATASGVMLSLAADGADPAAPGASSAAPAPSAAAAPKATAAAPAPSGPPQQIAPKGPPIVLEAQKGTLISLPQAAATVFIANPDVADVQVKSPKLIYVTAKIPGETVLYAVDADDHVLLNAPVRVEHDLSRVRQSVSAVAPGENVNISSVDNSLVLSGNVKSAGDAERVRTLATAIAKETKGNVVNRLGVATPNQVNIRVKVAEVDRQVLKSLGVNLSKLGGKRVNFFTDNPVTSTAILNRNALSTMFGTGTSTVTTVLDALAQEGLVTVLAEPNLTATNGQPASFLAGGEFPVPISGAAGSAGGAPTITVDFKKFGVALDVTPTIVDAEHLSMRIRTEVSQLSTNGAVSLPITATASVTIPALTERTAETTVELGSGESFMLGGLLQHTSTQDISKVPWLGDIPILGQLFRSERFENDESELVIIVTPYLVKPTLTSMAAPTDGFAVPHDAQRVINGSTYRQGLPGPAKGPVSPGGSSALGPVGFRLD